MPGPVSGGGPRPLAAEADRERLVALLREHYAVGLFDLDELDRRVEMVLTAQYLDQAAAAVADLPGVPATGPGTLSSGTLSSGTGAPSGDAAPRRAKRRRGHAHADRPAAGWIPTDERFRDPATRAVMRVWVDPADQSRHYIPEPEA